MDPKVAEEVTIGGMDNVLTAMSEAGVRKICFTDSIGSFGASAPRENCSARWLSENPTQDPGSDYGIQKRGCRELMNNFAMNHNGDPRFAVLPGVLHSEALWGAGTTEYALEALQAAAAGETFVCPLDPNVKLPMIFVDDLMRGMLTLQDALEEDLREPGHGYCIPGLSFTAYELFEEIKHHYPNFTYTVGELDPNVNKFANLWPDSLSTIEAERDLKFQPRVGLPEMVDAVLAGHEKRRSRAKAAFEAADADGNEILEKPELEELLKSFVRVPKHYESRRGTLLHEIVEKSFEKMDLNKDGKISFEEFEIWSKTNSLKDLINELNN